MRAALLVKKLLAENFIGKPHASACKFHGRLFEPGSAGRIGGKDRDQRLNVLTLREFTWKWCSAGSRYRRRVRARKILNAERLGYRVIVPDCSIPLRFENGAEGVLELVACTPAAPNDRCEFSGSAARCFTISPTNGSGA